jgi:phospholipase C
MRPGRIVAIIAAGAAMISLVAAPSTRVSAAGPCGTLTYDASNPPVYRHVLVVMDENVSYANLTKAGVAPYLNGLASACGSELAMHAATHPSQPNYMAATSGVATSVGAHTSNDNIFRQLQDAGLTWGAFQESMPTPCAATSAMHPAYKPGHNPPIWYTNLTKPTNTCAVNDLPMSPSLDSALAEDSLPSFAWITPNLCHDMHWDRSCPYAKSGRIARGDTWLSTFVPRITALPSFARGETLLIITFDEGDGGHKNGVDCTDPSYYPTHPDCRIATVVVSPYITPGQTDATDHNLYGLLGTVEDIYQLDRLGRADGQSSLRPGLGF